MADDFANLLGADERNARREMSDVMLHGVLNMSPDLWTGDPVDVAQRHGRYAQASERITALEAQRYNLLTALRMIAAETTVDGTEIEDLRAIIQGICREAIQKAEASDG